MASYTKELERLLREARVRAAPDSTWAQVPVIEIDALLAQADKDNKLQAQGLCETTLTPRFQIPNCTCETYKDNLGPCLTWWEGGRVGYCVYCDHNLDCHVKLSKMLANKNNAGEQVSQAVRSERIAGADSPSASGLESATSAGCLPAPAAPSENLPPVMESCGGAGRNDVMGYGHQFPVSAPAPAEAPTLKIREVLHILRNPHGYSQETIYTVRQEAADYIEQFERSLSALRMAENLQDRLDRIKRGVASASEREGE